MDHFCYFLLGDLDQPIFLKSEIIEKLAQALIPDHYGFLPSYEPFIVNSKHLFQQNADRYFRNKLAFKTASFYPPLQGKEQLLVRMRFCIIKMLIFKSERLNLSIWFPIRTALFRSIALI